MLLRTILVLVVLQLLVANPFAAVVSKRCKQILANEIDDVDEFDINDCLHSTYEDDKKLTLEQMKTLLEAINKVSDGTMSQAVYKRLRGSVEGHNRRVKRAAAKIKSRWNMHRDSEGNLLIPVEIINNVTMEVREAIQQANESLIENTCIRLITRTIEEPYLKIGNFGGCSSIVGRVVSKGYQKLSLGKSCKTFLIVMHELMHTLGFLHEQSRPDRDDYITVLYENIKPGKYSAFRKYEQYEVDSFNSPFDIDSVMMYNAYSYAIRKKGPSMVDKDTGLPIEKNRHFTNEDIAQINAMHNCENKKKYCDAPQLTIGARYGSSNGDLLKERDHGRTFDHGEWLNISSCPEKHSPADGVTKAFCLDGSFQPKALLCKEDPCLPPKVNGEGHLKEWDRESFGIGEKVTVVCGHLHSVIGSSTAICGEHGFDVTEFNCVDDYPDCVNQMKSCDSKAMNTDRCEKSNAETGKCRRSCGCGEGPIVCKDIITLEDCKRKKENDKCETDYNIMFKHCRATCGWCN